jgi:ankyrin repeat protein
VDAVLPIAISRGHEQIVEVLLAAHADPNAPDATGTTPLQHALAGGKEEIVRSLLAHGADARQIDHSNNRGLLHQLCAQASTRFGSAQFIPLLIEFGADPAQRDQFGETPLDLALANKNESAVAALLKLSGAGAEKAMEDATLRGYTETARMLLENGLAPNQLTTRGSTYLGDAALKGQTAMVGLLLQHGANLALRDRFGGTPLHDAALGGSPAVINFLLDHGAEIDARNTDGRATPLMLAASMGSKETVQALLHRGANTHLLDSSGRTALDRARENANPEIVSLLLHDM